MVYPSFCVAFALCFPEAVRLICKSLGGADHFPCLLQALGGNPIPSRKKRHTIGYVFCMEKGSILTPIPNLFLATLSIDFSSEAGPVGALLRPGFFAVEEIIHN
jgi:hypothetical protein